jgi:hypothetical protein
MSFKEVNSKRFTRINRASTLSLVFEALDDTSLEDDDERILSFFIEGLQVVLYMEKLNLKQ